MALLHGLTEIARYCRRSTSAVHRWIKRHGMPAALGPDGSYMTSEALIDGWIVSRRAIATRKAQEGHNGGTETQPRPGGDQPRA